MKICANWSGPLKIVWYKLSEFENVSEMFLKIIASQVFILFCDDPGSGKKLSMTDKMMSDQVDILISDVPIYEPVV